MERKTLEDRIVFYLNALGRLQRMRMSPRKMRRMLRLAAYKSLVFIAV